MNNPPKRLRTVEMTEDEIRLEEREGRLSPLREGLPKEAIEHKGLPLANHPEIAGLFPRFNPADVLHSDGLIKHLVDRRWYVVGHPGERPRLELKVAYFRHRFEEVEKALEGLLRAFKYDQPWRWNEESWGPVPPFDRITNPNGRWVPDPKPFASRLNALRLLRCAELTEAEEELFNSPDLVRERAEQAERERAAKEANTLKDGDRFAKEMAAESARTVDELERIVRSGNPHLGPLDIVDDPSPSEPEEAAQEDAQEQEEGNQDGTPSETEADRKHAEMKQRAQEEKDLVREERNWNHLLQTGAVDTPFPLAERLAELRSKRA